MADCVPRWSLLRFDNTRGWWWNGDAQPTPKERWIYVVRSGRTWFEGLPITTRRPRRPARYPQAFPGHGSVELTAAVAGQLFDSYGMTPPAPTRPLSVDPSWIIVHSFNAAQGHDQLQKAERLSKADGTFTLPHHSDYMVQLAHEPMTCRESAYINAQLASLGAPTEWIA